MVVVGSNHASAFPALLERLSIPDSEVGSVLALARRAAREALVLSTCNRTEIYAVTAHSGSGRDAILRLLSDRAGTTPDELLGHAYVLTDAAAVRHAFQVASGLDSMVLGESQIQRQWKRGLAHARVAQALGPTLERLGSAALACGKRVRTFTGIGRHSVSVESLAVRATEERLGDLTEREILVIGAGESAGLVVRHLRNAGAARITVLSRTRERAEELAQTENVRAEGIERIGASVARADAIFCCTSAPHPVLGADHFSERRAGAPIVCVDLGMPRDIDDPVESIAGVQLVRLEELAGLAEAHRAERREHVPAADAIVEVETRRFLSWQHARTGAGSITRLQEHARQIAQLELDVALARLGELPPRDRDIIAAMAHRIVKKLMHSPSEILKQHPESENLALALECAFGLPGAAQALERQLPDPSGAPDAPQSIEEAS